MTSYSAAHTTDRLAHQAATSPNNDLPHPTPEQKESGEYVKGHLTIAGLPIAIENPQGSKRSGVDADGQEWSVTMQSHYGYIEGTKGADGDEVDVIVVPGTDANFAGDVYVIAQNDQNGAFDEHKVVIGAMDADQAIEAYHANYDNGWNGFGSIQTFSMADFKEWLALLLNQMMFDAIGKDLAAITDQDVQDDPIGVLDLCLDVFETNTAVVVVGNELGIFPDTEDGKKALRLAAKEEFKKLLGEWIDCPCLDVVEGTGAKVEIRNRGIKEFMAFSGDPRKLKLVAVVSNIIKTANLSSDSWQDNQKKERKPNVAGYYHLKNMVVVEGELIEVSVLIEKDDNGLLHYDILVPKKNADGFDSIETKKSDQPIPDNYSGGRSDKDSKPQVIDSVNRADFDENADFVVNMFISGRDSNKTPNFALATTIIPTGRENTVKTAKGTQVATSFAVVEADRLITSHDSSGNENPAFPQELQPRDRSRETSQAWVQKVAADLDPDSLGRTRRADTGAPIVGADGIVESGNGRTMAIRLAYERGTAGEYRKFLIEEAEYFGLDAAKIEGMKHPVLVRVRTGDIDRRAFTVEANQDDKLTFTATERARTDAKRLDGNLLALFMPGEDGDLLNSANQKFIQGFLQSLGDTEAAQYITSDGKPTKALVDRVKAAVFSKAYNDDRLLEMMADETKPEIQNVLNALSAAAPRFIDAQSYGRVATENVSEQMIDGIEQSLDKRVVDAVVDATRVLLSSRAANQDITEYVRQQGLFEDVDEGVAALAVFLAKNSRSAKRMSIAFKAMADFVKTDALDQANGGLFGEPEPPRMVDVVAAANRQLELVYGDDQGNNIGLFDSTFEQDGLSFLSQQDLEKYQQNKIRARTPRGHFIVPLIRRTLLRIEGFYDDSDGSNHSVNYSGGQYGSFIVSFGRDVQNMLIIIRKMDDGGFVCGWPITDQDSTSMLVRRIIDVLGVPMTDVIETMFDSLDQPVDLNSVSDADIESDPLGILDACLLAFDRLNQINPNDHQATVQLIKKTIAGLSSLSPGKQAIALSYYPELDALLTNAGYDRESLVDLADKLFLAVPKVITPSASGRAIFGEFHDAGQFVYGLGEQASKDVAEYKANVDAALKEITAQAVADWNEHVDKTNALLTEISKYYHSDLEEDIKILNDLSEKHKKLREITWAKFVEPYNDKLRVRKDELATSLSQHGQKLIDDLLQNSQIDEAQALAWANQQLITPAAEKKLKRTGYPVDQVRRDAADLYRLTNGRLSHFVLDHQLGNRRASTTGSLDRSSDKVILLDSDFNKTVLFHEMGHHMESDKALLQAAQAFLKKRRESDKLFRLQDLVKNSKYRRDELAYKDSFFNPYIGKYYRDGTTEVWSMGVESLASPAVLAQRMNQDPEMMALIMGALKSEQHPFAQISHAVASESVQNRFEQKASDDAKKSELIGKIAGYITLTQNDEHVAENTRRFAFLYPDMKYLGSYQGASLFAAKVKNLKTKRKGKGILVCLDGFATPLPIDDMNIAKAFIATLLFVGRGSIRSYSITLQEAERLLQILESAKK